MTDAAQPKTYADFVLPPSVVSKLDVSRLVSEAERVDNDMTAAAVRAKEGVQQQNNLTMSAQLSDFVAHNKLDLANSRARTELIPQLRALKDNVPIIHMTFATAADPESLQQLANWLRTSVHPQAVIGVGLQPALIAGVYLRTPNHVHDLSMRAKLKNGHSLIVKELETLRAGR